MKAALRTLDQRLDNDYDNRVLPKLGNQAVKVEVNMYIRSIPRVDELNQVKLNCLPIYIGGW